MGDREQSSYNVVLSFKIHLDLVHFCLICGKHLKDNASNTNSIINPLNHILSSPCFAMNSGQSGVKDIKLFQDGNENTAEVNLDKQINQDTQMSDNDQWKVEDGDREDSFDDYFDDQTVKMDKDEQTPKLFHPRFNCDECEAFFLSSECLKWHKDLSHQETVGFHCSICNLDFLSLEVTFKQFNKTGYDRICNKKLRISIL